MVRILLLLNFLLLATLAASSSSSSSSSRPKASKPPKLRRTAWVDDESQPIAKVENEKEDSRPWDLGRQQYSTRSVGDYMTLSTAAQQALWRASKIDRDPVGSRGNVQIAIYNSSSDKTVRDELQRFFDKGLKKASDKHKYTHGKKVATDDPRRVQAELPRQGRFHRHRK